MVQPFMSKVIDTLKVLATGRMVITSTNGHFLQTEEEIDKLIDSELDALVFAKACQATAIKICGKRSFLQIMNTAGLNMTAARNREL